MTTTTEARHLIESITERAKDATGADRILLRDRVHSLIDECEVNIDFYCFYDNNIMIERWEQVRDEFEKLYRSLL
jgi:hypothetical protein